MATEREVWELADAYNKLSSRAQSEIASLFNSLKGLPPEQIRNALLEIVPFLVADFGQSAAAVAAEWFEATTGQRATLASTVDTEDVARIVRYRAGNLWTPEPASMLTALAVDVDKYVKLPGRNTLFRSARQNNMRYARQPRGAKTCAFCLMLAGRDAEWLYTSKRSAGERGSGNEFHGDCDCAVIPVSGESDLPFDPEGYFTVYRAATDAVGSRANTKEILMHIRREFPDLVTDVVVPTK